jgi:cyclic beta-1,2-glucan synthetase
VNFLKLLKTLNIKGALLDQYQLENYLEKIASDHILKDNSNKETYPIPRLEENFKFITKTYELLNTHLKMGINTHPAGEWLLDNYYVIEETVKTIKKELPLKKYKNFVSLATEPYKGFARIYVVACEIVAYTEGKIDSENLQNLLIAYQRKKTLNMEEIWNISIFLQIAIIETIRNVCEKIYTSQMQKYKVENIIERLVELKTKDELKFYIKQNRKNKTIESIFEMKYPFIEYMSYRLKRYGKKSYPYLKALEEEVMKMGTSVSDVIKKEHFDIAVRKVTIGNCIKSIKEIERINFLEIFENINGVEEVLKQDPVGVYENMDYKTKTYYRNKIKEISKKTKISEIYITKKALELAQHSKDTNSKTAHIGYYLIDKGEIELYNALQTNKTPHISKQNEKIYITFITLISILLSILITIYFAKQTYTYVAILIGIIFFIPMSQIATLITQFILGKIVKPKIIPKMDYINGVPPEQGTMVIIPTILTGKEKVVELTNKLEVFYLANKSDNIYFTLLGDVTASKNKEEPFDEEIIKTGREEVEKLNKKYPNNEMGRFQFIYRNREWNDKEECYLGWERKRGMIASLNEYLCNGTKGLFRVNTMEENESKICKIKYIITLDSDTNLVLNSGLELIGTAAHILNKPELNKTNDAVISGYGIIQPRIGIDLNSARKSIFTKIFAGAGGVDLYTNAISDTYQDNFGEGIFTGKGIYNLDVFYKILKDEIPQNKVLSHDLLEGCYLRCALATDIMLLDGYPYKYNAYASRLNRWIRGDWQITNWLKKRVNISKDKIKNNPLNTLSKFKILDNLRRSLVEISIIISLLILIIIKINSNIKISLGATLLFIVILFPSLLECICYIFERNTKTTSYKYFSKNISGIKASILRGIIELSILPHKAYISLNAIVKTIYRTQISHKHLLEWTTAEEAEKNGKTDLLSYYKCMGANVIVAFFLVIIIPFVQEIAIPILILAILWLIAPTLMWYISKEKIEKPKVKEISNEQREYILDIGKKTWCYFEKYMNEKNNFLPPDNYQEDRTPKVVARTSSTNIGLGLITIISAYDLGYIDITKTIKMLKNTILTIEKLDKWNGHLYNWYNIENLKPLIPRYISTVDSGNFIGYLYLLRNFLINILNEQNEKIDKQEVQTILQMVENFINNTDFKYLYDEEKRLFSIGFNVEENKLTDSYYDLLASEARQASLVAIAKHDVPSKHWQNLSRTLTVNKGYMGLVSWSGTAFEYLMPNINIKEYEGSLLDESCKFMIMSQREYANRLGIPWGISESAFNLKDLNSNYQYKAFGIPWLGLKRGLADEMVVSSYGSILALQDEPLSVIQNMKTLEQNNMVGKYGFYEAIDYTPGRVRNNKKYEVVKTYMAHHQALILLAINNLVNNNILQQRFMENPEIKAVDILLQERMPDDVIITKEKKEKIEKIKNVDYENYTTRVYKKQNEILNNFNVISNEDYTICINEKGEGFSKYKNLFINRYKYTNDYPEGISFYIKNIRTKRIWNTINRNDMVKPDKIEVDFSPDQDKFIRVDENIITTCKIITAPTDAVEIRSITLENTSNIEEVLEVSTLFEPVLSTKEQDYSHTAFNNLFLKYEYLEDTNSILVKRNKRGDTSDVYLGVNLCTNNETIGDIEYEIDKAKLYGGATYGIPKMIENSIPFSKTIGLTVDPIVALKRTLKIEPNQKVTLNLIIAVSEEQDIVIKNMEKYTNTENVKKAFELSRVRVEEEARYLGIKGKDIENYQKLLSYLIVQNPLKKLQTINTNKIYNIKDLWQYGISGDLPILLVKIKDVNDSYVIKEILKAFEYFKVKNIEIDLVILNEEENVYERYVKEMIETQILNRHLMYLLNQKAGIYILNSNEIKNIDLLEFRANFIIDAHKGNLKTILHDLEEDYLDTIKVPKYEENMPVAIPNIEKKNNLINMEQLKYYNEYGGFTDDGKEYVIKITKDIKPEVAWSNVLTNPNFGSVVTTNNSGYTWYKNSRLNRITQWSNNALLDTPSEIIYIKDKKYNEAWTLCPNLNQDDEDYYITYGFGYSKFKNMRLGLLQEQETFVPINDNVKISILRLKNTLPEKRNLKLIYYVKPILGEDAIKSDGYIHINYDHNKNIIYAKNQNMQDLEKSSCYVSTSLNIKSYTGDKKSFFGGGNLKNPDGINMLNLNNEEGNNTSSCIAIEMEIELKAFEDKEIILLLGAEEDKEKMQDIAYKYTIVDNAKTELESTKQYWSNLLRTVQVKTPVESMNILLNGWLVYQTITSRLWAKSGFYQSGGAYGFRDQLQDTMGIKYINPSYMKEQILKHASHQFIEGDVEHWWHEETKRGIRTKFSDDLLWLAYVTAEYIKFTGDASILDEEAPYIEGKILDENTDENYDIHPTLNTKESIYKHCIRAINKAINIGRNGIPKIGSGDWNDGFSTVGNKGVGESIWLGFFLYEVLNRFIPICQIKNDNENIEKYKKTQEELKKALNTNGWDGRWYRRAYTDDGSILGSIQNEECKIDSIAQTWSVISGAGDSDKQNISMESLENYLIDKQKGIIKLLDPAFEKSTLEPGYIKSYLPGVRENGGQYTHAAIWVIIAEAMLNNGDKATEYFRMINPIEHARTKEEATHYKVEPYVISADVYGVGNLAGRGGWTWYTGSASWMYKAGIEYILGLKIENEIMYMQPSISSNWKEYSIRYEYKTSVYNIKVKNPDKKNTGVQKFILNGAEIPEKQIKLIDNGKINEIEIIM